jgi:hypothetical protein
VLRFNFNALTSGTWSIRRISENQIWLRFQRQECALTEITMNFSRDNSVHVSGIWKA